MRYPYEVRDAAEYFSDIATPRVTREMVALAEHILATKEGKFDPSEFKDQYETALKTLVRRKAAGEVIEAPQEPTHPHNVIDLMDALKRSLKSGNAKAVKARPARTRAVKSKRHRAA